MKVFHIASIPGDGIGPEVIREGRKVLDAVSAADGSFRFEWEEFPWGCEYYLQHGIMSVASKICMSIMNENTLFRSHSGISAAISSALC